MKNGRESEGGRARDSAGSRAGGFMLGAFSHHVFKMIFSVVDFRWILLAFREASGSDFGGQVGAKIDLKSHFFGSIFEGLLSSRNFIYFFDGFSRARNVKNVVFS